MTDTTLSRSQTLTVWPISKTTEIDLIALDEVTRAAARNFVLAHWRQQRARFKFAMQLADAYELVAAEYRSQVSWKQRHFAPYEDLRLWSKLRAAIAAHGSDEHESAIVLANRACDAHRLRVQFPDWIESLEFAEVTMEQAGVLLRFAKRLPATTHDEFALRLLVVARHASLSQTIREAKRLAGELTGDE